MALLYTSLTIPPSTMPAGNPKVIPARTMPMLVPRELASLTSAVIVYAVANTSALPIPHVTRATMNQSSGVADLIGEEPD